MSQDALPATEGTVLPADLVARVTAWVAEDPDPGARAELRALLAQGDEAGLRDRFDHPLAFGTAGLRGPLGAGPARVNQAVVRRTTAGLVSYLRQRGQGTGAGVVVGHDARHRSAELAGDAARVVAAGGLRAWHFRSALPTPVTAFAVRHLEAAAGVVVTASHNPAPDNGYKVYLSDGALVFPPHDAAIAAAASRTAMPLGPTFEGPFGDRLVDIDEAEVLAAYRRAVLAVVSSAGPAGCASSTRPCTGWAAQCCPGSSRRPASTVPPWWRPRPPPTRTSPRHPSPTPRNPGCSTWPWPRPGA